MKAVPANLIRARAYAIWEQNGRPSGLDKQHWEQAEREFLDAAALLAGADYKTLLPSNSKRANKPSNEDRRTGKERRSGIDTRSEEDN